MPRPFVMWPDKRLRSPAAPVAAITDDVKALWDEMIEAMEAMPGVGLAAPQLGVMLRLAVVDASEKRGKAVRMANPEVLHASIEPRWHDEASPNLPGVSAPVERPRAVSRVIALVGKPIASTCVEFNRDLAVLKELLDPLLPLLLAQVADQRAALARLGLAPELLTAVGLDLLRHGV